MDRLLPLRDATSSMTVKIQERDRKAVTCDPQKCVIANAIRRLPGVVDVRVGAETVRIQRKDAIIRYDIDKESAALIASFDRSEIIIPRDVRIFLNPPRRPLGTRSNTKRGSNKKTLAGNHVSTRRPSLRHILVERPDVEG